MNPLHLGPPAGVTRFLCFALGHKILVHRRESPGNTGFRGVLSFLLLDSTAEFTALKSWKPCILLGFLFSRLGQSDAVSYVISAEKLVFSTVFSVHLSDKAVFQRDVGRMNMAVGQTNAQAGLRSWGVASGYGEYRRWRTQPDHGQRPNSP